MLGSDNVGFRCFGQRTQLGQGVVGLLVLRQHLSHGGQDAAAQRDVTRFHRNACFGRKGLNDGKKTRDAKAGPVRKGVKNLGHTWPQMSENRADEPTSTPDLSHHDLPQACPEADFQVVARTSFAAEGQHGVQFRGERGRVIA